MISKIFDEVEKEIKNGLLEVEEDLDNHIIEVVQKAINDGQLILKKNS